MANVMQAVRLEKLTLNVGVGAPGERLENAKVLLERISGGKAVMTQSKDRNPTFKIRKGDNIGAKVTLRGPEADAVLRKALDVRDFTLLESSFDKFGNVAFGIKEFDVCVTLAKAGRRVARRKISASRIPQKQRVSREEAKDFMVTSYKVKVEVPSEE